MLYDPKWEQNVEAKQTVRSNLIAARKMIEDPNHWCQGSYQDGEAFCAMGALDEVTMGEPTPEGFAEALEALSAVVGGDIVYFNDTHTHAEVLAAFDRAIASA